MHNSIIDKQVWSDIYVEKEASYMINKGTISQNSDTNCSGLTLKAIRKPF